MKETKKAIVKDIMELTEWCYNNDKKKECVKTLENNGQNKYCSNELFERTLLNKTKQVLDNIRYEILEKVIYA